MSKTKTKPIKAKTGLTKTAPADVLSSANAVLNGISADTADYPNPSVDMATFKANIDTLSSDITAALDGGKKAIAQRNHQVEVVIRMFRQLAHYVEANCKDDVTTFLKSGFQVATKAKPVGKPLSQFIRKIDQGPNSGQLLVMITAVAGAASYELRWAPLGTGGTPGTWTNQHVGKTRPPTLISGLTPGTTYAFQVRSLGNSGFSDWSDSVTRMCT